jgi:hypothetical protein
MPRLASGMRRFVVLGISSSAVKKHEQRKKTLFRDESLTTVILHVQKCTQVEISTLLLQLILSIIKTVTKTIHIKKA